MQTDTAAQKPTLTQQNKRLRPALWMSAIAALVGGLLLANTGLIYTHNGIALFGKMMPNLMLWLAVLGALAWLASCVVTAILSGDIILRIGAILSGLAALVVTAYFAYMAVDYWNIMMTLRYGMEAAVMLGRTVPQVLLVLLWCSTAVYLLAMILRVRSIATIIVNILAIITCGIGVACLIAALINRAPGLFLVGTLLPAGAVCVGSIVAALSIKTK